MGNPPVCPHCGARLVYLSRAAICPACGREVAGVKVCGTCAMGSNNGEPGFRSCTLTGDRKWPSDSCGKWKGSR